jgi:hypothetical protein
MGVRLTGAGERPSTVVGVPAGRAVPASGRYRASVGPVRSGNGWADALVTVQAAGGGGPHCLEVAELGGASGTRGRAVRVAFEDRG